MSTPDPFHLARFVQAQQPVYATVLAELRAADKRSHWMWFIFPQVRGLGSSSMAQHYAITGLEEARAYLAHPLLGARLRECTALVNAAKGRTLSQIFGYPDDMKFYSSMTLFAQADEQHGEFQTALQQWFAGRGDQATLARLRT